MKLIKVSNTGVSKVEAKLIKTRNSKHYNICFGSKGNGLWEVRLLLDKRFFKPDDNVNEIELKDDNYVIYPYKDKDGKVVKDQQGNILYIVTIDRASFHKRDVLLFWEIPNFNDINVTYDIEGSYNLIGEGFTGKERGDTIYRSPALVLELMSDVKLTWKSDTRQQIILFNYNTGTFEAKDITNILD